jgi:hypothetical protein
LLAIGEAAAGVELEKLGSADAGIDIRFEGLETPTPPSRIF